MRETIIGVFAVIVFIVSMLSFALMRATIGDVSNKGESQRAVTAAVAQLQVEGLRIERWLATQTATEDAREPFEKGSPGARADSATQLANTLQEKTKGDPAFAAVPASLIVVFDANGKSLGRDRSALMRGDDLGARHPALLAALKAGHTGSDVWVSKKHSEQVLASYAPIRNADGEIIGGIAVGTAFNNERLQKTSEATSKLPLFAGIKGEGAVELLAKSENVTEEMLAAVSSGDKALSADQVVALSGLGDNWDTAGGALSGYGDGKRAVIMSTNKATEVGSFKNLMWPFIGVLVLGLLLVGAGAHLIDNYISQPISDLEDGLLAIINGQTDMRFELEHKVLGGLVFRVNTLLNQLLGVREDDTDEQGRPSIAPSAQAFTAALNVDERMVSLSAEDVDDAQGLRAEAPEDYYKRIFDEYRDAKKAVGDPVDHVKFAPFIARIKSSEQQLSDKHGKPFRYKIEAKGKEVVFVAVPLA
jgi:hypothetical protein